MSVSACAYSSLPPSGSRSVKVLPTSIVESTVIEPVLLDDDGSGNRESLCEYQQIVSCWQPLRMVGYPIPWKADLTFSDIWEPSLKAFEQLTIEHSTSNLQK